MTQTVPYSFVSPSMWKALNDLRDSTLTCKIPILEGKAPGMWKIFQSFDPPGGIRDENTCARVSVKGMPGWDFNFEFFVQHITQEPGCEIFILGPVAPLIEEYVQGLTRPVYIGAQFQTASRRGRVLAPRAFVRNVARRMKYNSDEELREIFGGALVS